MEKPDKKALTRARILVGAGRSFRSQGYGGAGVDGVAREAGVTSGAFYAYFKSKAAAFRETVISGMQDLERGVRQFRAEDESSWLTRFVDFYLGDRRTCDLTESCALQSLTGEVARADAETRKAFETQLRAVIAATAEGISAPSAAAQRQQALVMLALLSGGVSLARAVHDPALSLEIASAIRASLLGAPLQPQQPPTGSKQRRSPARSRA